MKQELGFKRLLGISRYQHVIDDEATDSADITVIAAPTQGKGIVAGTVYDDTTGGVNAGNEVEFFNPPIPGKKISVTGRIHNKYMRRDKPYLVIEATAIDEDGRLLEKLRTYQMKKPDEVGKKWHPQS